MIVLCEFGPYVCRTADSTSLTGTEMQHFSLTVGSFLLTVELLCSLLTVVFGAFVLTMGQRVQ